MLRPAGQSQSLALPVGNSGRAPLRQLESIFEFLHWIIVARLPARGSVFSGQLGQERVDGGEVSVWSPGPSLSLAVSPPLLLHRLGRTPLPAVSHAALSSLLLRLPLLNFSLFLLLPPPPLVLLVMSPLLVSPSLLLPPSLLLLGSVLHGGVQVIHATRLSLHFNGIGNLLFTLGWRQSRGNYLFLRTPGPLVLARTPARPLGSGWTGEVLDRTDITRDVITVTNSITAGQAVDWFTVAQTVSVVGRRRGTLHRHVPVSVGVVP